MSAFFYYQKPDDTIRITPVTAGFFLFFLSSVMFESEKQKKGTKK